MGCIESPHYEHNGRLLPRLAKRRGDPVTTAWIAQRASQTIDAEGKSALLVAARHGHLEALEALIAEGAREDPSFGHSAITVAVGNDRERATRKLVHRDV